MSVLPIATTDIAATTSAIPTQHAELITCAATSALRGLAGSWPASSASAGAAGQVQNIAIRSLIRNA